MHGIVSLLTAAGVLLHLILGCCAHQGCAQAAPKVAQSQPEPQPVHSCCRHRHPPIEPARPASPPAKTPADDPCEHGDCSFSAATQEVQLPAPPLAVFAAEVVLPEVSLSVAVSCDENLFAPPCRLHLKNGVFLL